MKANENLSKQKELIGDLPSDLIVVAFWCFIFKDKSLVFYDQFVLTNVSN